jgi:hypothetical protein
MPAIDYSSHVTNPAAQGPQAAATAARGADTSGFSFGDFLDIINPLQHIPVVSTLYRKLTGDEIGTPEKIAGDTLYGGVIGFVTSLADSAFQKVTGHNVGDTVLAFLTGSDDTKIAAQPASVQQASVVSIPAPLGAAITNTLSASTPDLTALMNSMSAKGVGTDTAARAAYAYGKTLALGAPVYQPN